MNSVMLRAGDERGEIPKLQAQVQMDNMKPENLDRGEQSNLAFVEAEQETHGNA